MRRAIVSEKNGNAVDASGTLPMTGLEVIVPSRDMPDDKKKLGVTAIDFTNQQRSARRQVPGKQATGPRTDVGKHRSSRNSIKHGIFSEATLLKGESRAEFESLRIRLLDTLRPEGMLNGEDHVESDYWAALCND
jgi:hypothetical protein